MAVNYKLLPNESIILKANRIAKGGVIPTLTDDLILTNLHIVWLDKSVLGTVKSIITFPLNQIKIFDNKAQVFVNRAPNGTPQLDIFFRDGEEVFGFEKRSEAVKWANEINQLLTGNTLEELDEPGYSSSLTPGATVAEALGVDVVTDQIKTTVDTFKSAFGLRSSETETKTKTVKIQKVTTKCRGCHAPLAGVKGKIVTCKYCDTKQTL